MNVFVWIVQQRIHTTVRCIACPYYEPLIKKRERETEREGLIERERERENKEGRVVYKRQKLGLENNIISLSLLR